MWFKHRAWVPVAWLLAGVNLAAAWFAGRVAVPGEAWHATTHAFLAVVLAVAAVRLGRRRALGAGAEPDISARVQDLEDRMADIGRLPDVGRLAELEERMDFTERALVEVRKRAELPPKS